MLKIHDLTTTEELDRDAMEVVAGGWTYTSAKSFYDYDNVTTLKQPNGFNLLTADVQSKYIRG